MDTITWIVEVKEAETVSSLLDEFLAKAALLPAEVNEENYEEVGALLEEILAVFAGMSEEEQADASIADAYAKVLSLWEEYEGVKAEILALGDAVMIGDTIYDTITEAVKAAQSGDVITLLKDVAESVTVSKSVTFDLGGHTWTGRGDTTLIVNGANDVTMTVKNGTMKAASGVDPSSTGAVIHADKCDLTIENCTFDSAVKRLVQVSVSSAKIHPNVVLTIKGSSFSNATYAAVYAAAEGSITGRSMKVEISDTTFKDNVRGLHCSVNSSISKPVFDVDVAGCTFEGSGNLGAGISVANNKNNVANFTLYVANSNFLNGAGSAVKMNSFSDCATVSIVGGKISGNVVSYSSDSVIKVNGPFTMDGTTVQGNTGSLVMDLQKTNSVTIKNATITDNESTNSSDQRGAIYIDASANAAVNVSGSTFIGNTGR